MVDAMRLYDADTLQHWKAEMHCDPLTQHPGGEAALIATRANTAEAYARSCPVGADGWPLLPLVRHAIQFRDAHRQITAHRRRSTRPLTMQHGVLAQVRPRIRQPRFQSMAFVGTF